MSVMENRLWAAADQLWANSSLKPSEYSVPVLGMIFLRYADARFTQAQREIVAKGSGRRRTGKTDYQARGVLYLAEEARFSNIAKLPEGADIGEALNNAMKLIEDENDDLKGVLPRTYKRLENATLLELVRIMNRIELNGGDTFGKVYEYFLGSFAMKEGQKGGEFFTPESLVKLIVEVIEPFHGRIFDLASGSGGMFVWSAKFVQNHQKNPTDAISIFGQERVRETINLCRMNLAVHGLSGDIRQGNTYYEDIHKSVGRFDYVMANPPFNVSGVDKTKLTDDPRFGLLGDTDPATGTKNPLLPNTDNANYIWIQCFYAALNATGRAGFVMANSAADARGSEMEIRKKLIQSGAVDVMISVGPNMFYTVALPCTLWFFDKGKASGPNADKVLFIDARHIFRQIDRAHRQFIDEQVEFIANIVRLYRGRTPEFAWGSEAMLKEKFPKLKYADVGGLCTVRTRKEIEEQGWSLNPGRYVGVAEKAADEFEFAERLEEMNEELETLNVEARELEERIAENVANLLEAK